MERMEDIIDVEAINKKVEEWSNPIRELVDEFYNQYEERIMSFDVDWILAFKEGTKELLDKINGHISKEENKFNETMKVLKAFSKFHSINLDEYEVFHADHMRPFYYRKKDLEELLKEINPLFT